jgi:hypothetical protein
MIKRIVAAGLTIRLLVSIGRNTLVMLDQNISSVLPPLGGGAHEGQNTKTEQGLAY